MSSLPVKKIKAYIAAEMNILLSGVHGVGKSAKLNEACAQLGYKVKYYSAATLDSFTDLTGIPVPNIPEKTVEYFRPRDIEEADVIFFDELNRADARTLNTVLEIILEHSINGVPLPKLKSVVAAMNPVSEEYNTEELDKALLDRFDVYLEATPIAEIGYFVNKFGDRLGKAAVSFWNEYHESHEKSKSRGSDNKIAYISPRRLDKIVSAFSAIPARQTIVDTLPPEVSDGSVASALFRVLDEARKEPVPESVTEVTESVNKIVRGSIGEQQKPETGARVSEILSNPNLTSSDRNRLLMSIAASLNEHSSTKKMVRDFGSAILAMTATQRKTLQSGWGDTKISNLENELGA